MSQNNHDTFWILGGDLRSHWLAKHLLEEGKEVHCYAIDPLLLPKNNPKLHCHETLDFTEKKEDAPPIILFPLPFQNKEGNLYAPFHSATVALSKIFSKIPSHAKIFAGQVKEEAKELAKIYQLSIEDFFLREELAIANAVPTAEGCIQIIMERLPITLHDARVMVLGYGKVATATAWRLGVLGARVTIAARNVAQLEQARADGFHTERLGKLIGGLCCYNVIVNTIPAQVLGRGELEDSDEDCLIIDLASLPGGVDFKEAEKLQRTVVQALSLPGKVAPSTAGLTIMRSLFHMLDEEKEGALL
ncbi:MAG: dipicolinate synthase subunit DpsA [Eubacteriales bacterium]